VLEELLFYLICCFLTLYLQAKFSDDIPSEIHSKIHLVDLAGRYVMSIYIYIYIYIYIFYVDVQGMTLNCILIFIVTGSFLC